MFICLKCVAGSFLLMALSNMQKTALCIFFLFLMVAPDSAISNVLQSTVHPEDNKCLESTRASSPHLPLAHVLNHCTDSCVLF